MSRTSRGMGSGSFGGLVFLIGLVLVALAVILPVASDGFEDRWQWTLILVVGAALLAGGLAVASLAMAARSALDARDDLTKVSRKLDRVTARLDEVEFGMPTERESKVDRVFARETQVK